MDSINSTTKGKEEVISNRVERVGTWFRGQDDLRCYEREETVVLEKGKRKYSTEGNTQGELPQRN